MATKVLVVVDVQNDFVKGGVLAYGFPKQDNTGLIEKEVKEAVRNGDIVYATRDSHIDDYYLRSLEGQMLPIKHCIYDTKGWNLVPWLKELADEDIVQVYDKSTFGSVTLPDGIRKRIKRGDEISEIRIMGYCSSICVLANAVILRAAFPNTKITVLKDLCGDIDEESHLAALMVMKNQQIEIE